MATITTPATLVVHGSDIEIDIEINYIQLAGEVFVESVSIEGDEVNLSELAKEQIALEVQGLI